MEQHPTVDFGVPGPLVHFAEKFYRKGYEEMLCESFTRRPALHTVLMIHRIANGSSGELKQKYVGFLEQASRRQDIDKATRDNALEYYKYHTEGK
jgi:RNA-splicing ligase RtcB